MSTTLTDTQLDTLKAAIIANPAWVSFPLNADGFADLAAQLNKTANPNFFVWATDVAISSIKAAIIWANLTPASNPDGTTQWGNRSSQCQGKQANLAMLLSGDTFNGADVNIRGGLEDALTGIRSAADGSAQGAGWNAVQGTLSRKAKYGEKILADTTGGFNGSTKPLSATMTFEGDLQAGDVEAARMKGTPGFTVVRIQ